jgi:hypothetical protein
MVVGVMDLLPNRLLDPQTLGQPPRRSGATVCLRSSTPRFGTRGGVGAGSILERPSRAGVVVSKGHIYVTSVDLPHWGTGGELTR